jgi:hypothetical protein
VWYNDGYGSRETNHAQGSHPRRQADGHPPGAHPGEVALKDGDEMEVSAESGRIVLTPAAEPMLPGDLEAIREGEAEFARGDTRRLDDVLNGLGRKAK